MHGLIVSEAGSQRTTCHTTEEVRMIRLFIFPQCRLGELWTYCQLAPHSGYQLQPVIDVRMVKTVDQPLLSTRPEPASCQSGNPNAEERLMMNTEIVTEPVTLALHTCLIAKWLGLDGS